MLEHEPGRRLVASKNLTVGEDFFQGHFPGQPLMPAVLMVEALTQAASVLLLDQEAPGSTTTVSLRGVDNGRFRRAVVPGDILRLEVALGRRRSTLAIANVGAFVGDQRVAEARLLLAVEPGAASIHPGSVLQWSWTG